MKVFSSNYIIESSYLSIFSLLKHYFHKKIDIQEDSSEIGLIVENGPVDNAGKSKTQPNEDEIEAEKHIINDDDDDEDGDENDIW